MPAALLLTYATYALCSATRSDAPYRVHPSPGGDTLSSPWYVALVGPPETASPSFVWYTSAANRQAVLPGNNVPATSKSKDTSFTMFDLSRPTLVTVLLRGAGGDHAFPNTTSGHTTDAAAGWRRKGPTAITACAVLPSSAAIACAIAADNRSVSFTVDRPRQLCLIVNHDMDTPLCVFADPPEVDPPTGPDPATGLVYFGPGVHRVGAVNVTANQSVYLAGGAHVYGQVRAAGVAWDGFWDGGAPCDNVRVYGRGVLDGHTIPIDYHAHAMIELPACANIVVEGVTTIDSPQYQLNNLGPGGRVSFAKAIAWGFSTDGWSGGEYSV